MTGVLNEVRQSGTHAPKFSVTDCNKYSDKKLSSLTTHYTFTLRRKTGRLFIKMSMFLMRAKPNARPFCVDISWRSKFAQRMCEADSDCTHASLNQQSFLFFFFFQMTVDVSFCSAAFFLTSLTSLNF